MLAQSFGAFALGLFSVAAYFGVTFVQSTTPRYGKPNPWEIEKIDSIYTQWLAMVLFACAAVYLLICSYRNYKQLKKIK